MLYIASLLSGLRAWCLYPIGNLQALGHTVTDSMSRDKIKGDWLYVVNPLAPEMDI